MTKLLSGRFILTVASAIVFVVMSINGKLSGEAVASIIGTVFALYFTRADRKAKGAGQ